MKGPLPSLEIIVDPPAASPTAASPTPPSPTAASRPIPDDPVAVRRWPTVGPRAAAMLGAIVLLGIGALLVGRRGDTAPAGLDKNAVDALVDTKLTKTLQDLQRTPAVSAEVYRTILPSIVVIRSTRNGAADARESGLGTGVIINADGSIMTVLHVVDGSTVLRVTFADGTESAASITSADRTNDTAVLSPETKPEVIVPAVLGGGVRVGDETFAVGHPLGLIGSLSSGVISGLNRSIPREDEGRLEGLIQFDAAVNPGNSGGPLLDRAGRVVGIVTAIADPSQDGSFIGIGFAVPIATAGGAAGAPPR